mgnify:CR=1 FL=1
MLRSSKNCKAANKKIKEGTLIKVSMSPNIRVRIQDKEYGHLQDISWLGEPIVGVVTKTWGSGHGIREIEMLSSGEFLLITTNNGLLDLEVLGC